MLLTSTVWAAVEWPATTHETRPWAYHWWLGSAVDPDNLARELRRYREAGLGGVHVIPIYGARGAEARYLDYLSPGWFEAFQFCVTEAGRLGLGVDLTTGTGWCFGGPNVSRTDGGWRLRTAVFEVVTGEVPTNRWAPDSIVGLIAVTNGKAPVDLRPRLQPDGRLDWQPEEQGTRVYAVTALPEGPRVKRAAPGGAGLMINPFSPDAMTHYLARFSEAFDRYTGPRPRAMYHDSYEYASSWTPDFLSAFARRRGYRLEDHWPEFCQDPRTSERAARVRADYQETLSDLMAEDVFPAWIAWCQTRGIRTRNQAHGSPANLLDLYALADIPETEMFGRGTRDPLRSRFDARFGEGDRDPLISKFASSSAHTAGRRLVAAETGTWLAEHFCETLEELKGLADLLFVAGVNHIIYHGTCYSPDDAPWPGWLFYASTQMNPRNAFWRDVPVLNAYIERCQSLLQSGQPDNDLLLYWPLHDLWHSSTDLVTSLGVHRHEWLIAQPIGAIARRLWERGHGFDYVSDRQLAAAVVTDAGRVKLPGADYAAVLVPPVRFLPLPTLRRLLELAEGGATILFADHLPRDVPGLATLEERQAAHARLLARVGSPASDAPFHRTAVGRGRVLVGEVAAMLDAAGPPREAIGGVPGVRFIRRRTEDGRILFVANQGMQVLDSWFALATPARSVAVMDALTGRIGLAETRSRDHAGLEVRLRLDPGHSIFLRTFEHRAVKAPAWSWAVAEAEGIALPGPWQIEFIEGGPVLPGAYETSTLRSWTQNGDPETERFAGTAVYRTEFLAPPGPGPWLLDLGTVCHSARVRLNGEVLGNLILPPYRLEIPALPAGQHRLEIEVTNLSANRLRDLDRRQVPWRVFHDINLVNLRYQPFDASGWPVMDAGLLGPVRLHRAAH
jgi:hypothetical protein